MKRKPNISRGLEDLSVSVLARGSSMLLGLLLQSALAWTLGPEGRGEYAVCLIFSTLSAAIFMLGVDWAIGYLIASKKRPFDQVLTLAFFFPFVISIVMWPVMAGLVASPIVFFQQAPADAFFLCLAWATATICFTILISILRGLKRFRLLAVVMVSKLSAALALTIFLVLVLDFGVSGPIIADLTAGIFAFCAIAIVLVRRDGARIRKPDSETLKAVFSYGLRMVAGSVGMIANLRIATIMLAFYATKADVGYFALAVALLTQLGTIADAVNNVILPRSTESTTGRPELVSLAARSVSACVFVGGAMLLLLSFWIIPLVFSRSFYPSIELLWILFPGMWIRAVVKVLFSYFNGMNRPQVVSYNTVLNIALQILLFALLVPRIGLVGAALAATLASLFSALPVIMLYANSTDTPPLRLVIISREELVLFCHWMRKKLMRLAF